LARLELARLGFATTVEAAGAIITLNRAYWKLLLQIYGWGRTA
jgi:hypothetical protein